MGQCFFELDNIPIHHPHLCTLSPGKKNKWDLGIMGNYMGCPKHASDVSFFLTPALAIPWSAALWPRLAG